jgi:hypothetical protein
LTPNRPLAVLADVFHQDWDEDYSSPSELIRDYKNRVYPAGVPALICEIDSILSSPMSEAELERLWIDELLAYYMPTGDGLTYRQWFTEIRRILAE